MLQVLRNDNTALALVHGLIDILTCPSYVISPTYGFVAWNQAAKDLKKHGCNVQKLNLSDGDEIDCADKKYRLLKKPLNHKTDFVLCELHDVTSPAARIKYAGHMLDLAMEGASKP